MMSPALDMVFVEVLGELVAERSVDPAALQDHLSESRGEGLKALAAGMCSLQRMLGLESKPTIPCRVNRLSFPRCPT